jgi:hypothetical protein
VESADNHTGYGRSLTGEENFSMERVTAENKTDTKSKKNKNKRRRLKRSLTMLSFGQCDMIKLTETQI